MERRFRLSKSADFQRVRQFGKSFAHPLFVLIVLENSLTYTRFGIAAGRSVGSAVDRNRAKRLLRASVHTQHELVIPGWDVILLARKPILTAEFQHLNLAMQSMLHKSKVIANDNR